MNTTLPSLRNIEWRTLNTETNKINRIIPDISINNITELNDLIYAGAKLVCDIIGVPPKKTSKKPSKPGWEVRLETQIKKSTKTDQNGKQKDPGICGKRMGKTTLEKITVQLEEINLKFLAKKGRLKRYRQRLKQYRKQDIAKQQKKIQSTTGRAWHKNIPTTRHQRNRAILDENMATEKT